MERTTRVGNTKIISVVYSSIVHIGDSTAITPVSNILAVQREEPGKSGEEATFKDFLIFQQPMPKVYVTKRPHAEIINRSRYIDVGNIYIIGMSTSAVLHVGNTHFIDSEARVKHIRKLLPREKQSMT